MKEQAQVVYRFYASDTNRRVVTLHDDGRVELPEGVTIDEASRAFWAAVQTIRSEHPDDRAVDQFASAMKGKLASKRSQGRSGWDDPAACTAAYLSELLRKHVAKGDPLDVANFAMMLYQRGERITPGWACRVRTSLWAVEPQDCDWPVCGCDPHASAVIEALQESGAL